MTKPAARAPRWAWIVLALLLLFDVWYRAHTFSAMIEAQIGVRLWPVASKATEPVDCDEAAYAYIGKRVLEGDVLYRDLTENKPPGGYWIYTMAVGLGGADELTVRLLPIPFVLATIALVWWIGLRVAGPLAACVGAGVEVLLSTDPYLYGNGSNMEHAINGFSVASLACLIGWKELGGWKRLIAAGAFVGMASLVKQPAGLTGLCYVAAVAAGGSGFVDKIRSLGALAAGFAGVWAVAIATLIFQGAGHDAFEDIVRYGGALATDVPPAPGSPPFLVRCVTGNADPNGRLPWPFGSTDYLVWWGTGNWPVWMISVAAMGYFLFGPTSWTRRVVAGWTAAAWIEAFAPRLFWQHYYLLPTPRAALLIGIAIADASRHGKVISRDVVCFLALAVAGSTWIQTRDYLLVPAPELTKRYKGGGQWIALREMSRDLKRRGRIWNDPHLYNWGWQSPLNFYTGFDSITPHFFVDPLLKEHATDGHPLIRPRLDRIMADVRRAKPELIFCGYPPFPALHAYLLKHYYRQDSASFPPSGEGLWIRKEEFSRFEALRHSRS
jgi:hypothetical protein